MIIAVALFELHIPYAQSLKDKRMVMRSLRDKLRGRFEISLIEAALQDLHQRGRFALSFVAHDVASADSLLEKIQGFVESNSDGMLNGWTRELVEFDETVSLVS